MTEFQNLVYKITKSIPAGKVATYKQIAKKIGKPKAYRAVGTSLNKNQDPKHIPCHRVVASDGSLRGYAFGSGIKTKRDILIKEGVIFSQNMVDLKRSGWKN